MKIEFVGAAQTVTGSSYIVKNDEFTLMVDCGMFQGTRELKERNYLNLIYAPDQIDALILTHAHIDHSGLIPRLVRDGFSKPIYATKPTVDLCTVMLPDSAHIQEMDAEILNRRNKKLGRDIVDPLYTESDALNALPYFTAVQYDEIIQILPQVKARFRDAGHILGSASIELWVEEHGKTTKIVFSGDVGSHDPVIIRDPEMIDDADYLLIESTYGDRLHRSRTDTLSEFKQIIIDTHAKKGNVIIPSFAVERTQEIVFYLSRLFKNNEIPRMPVYIDSPLAIAATEIFRRHKECFNEDMLSILSAGDDPLNFPSLTYTKTTQESKELNERKGAIIISASGMCTAGRIKFHLMNNLYKSNASIVFVGYQAQGTLGRSLVDGAKRVKIYGDDVVVNAQIYTLGGFSAHADRDELIKWMGTIKNEKLNVFVVHGEKDAAQAFASTVNTTYNYQAYVPEWGEIVDLDTMKGEKLAHYRQTPLTVSMDDDISYIKETFAMLLEKYEAAKAGEKVHDVQKIREDIDEISHRLRSINDRL